MQIKNILLLYMYRSNSMEMEDEYLRQRIRDILHAQIQAQHEGGVLVGDGYISPRKAHLRALKAAKTRKMHLLGYGEGYGTKSGARKALRTKGLKPRRKVRGRGEGYGTRMGAIDNPWLQHVRQVRAMNPGLTYKEALEVASQSYTKERGRGEGVYAGYGTKKGARKGLRTKGLKPRRKKRVRKARAAGYYLY